MRWGRSSCSSPICSSGRRMADDDMMRSSDAPHVRHRAAPSLREAMPHLEERAIAHRRHLHRRPELSGEEHETTRYIADRLRGLGIRHLDFAGPGVVAQIDAGRAGGPIVALRADIDALPVPEDGAKATVRSEEHTSELQSRGHLVCRLLLEKKKKEQ